MDKKIRIILWSITTIITLISIAYGAYFYGYQKGVQQAYDEMSRAQIFIDSE